MRKVLLGSSVPAILAVLTSEADPSEFAALMDRLMAVDLNRACAVFLQASDAQLAVLEAAAVAKLLTCGYVSARNGVVARIATWHAIVSQP